MATPQDILRNPFLNKGTGFSKEEREELGLVGLLPSHVQTIEEQAKRVYEQYSSKTARLEKRIYLMSLFNTNRTLFFYLMGQHLREFMP